MAFRNNIAMLQVLLSIIIEVAAWKMFTKNSKLCGNKLSQRKLSYQLLLSKYTTTMENILDCEHLASPVGIQSLKTERQRRKWKAATRQREMRH